MTDNFVERRKFGRRSVLKRAVAANPDGSRIRGTVIDISEGGARFKSAHADNLQKTFVLEIAEDDFVVKCEIAHRLPGAVGVHFVESPRRLSWGRRVEIPGLDWYVKNSTPSK